VTICFFLTLIGTPQILDLIKNSPLTGGLDWLRQGLISFFDGISLMTHSNRMSSGLLRLDTLTYYISIIAFSLFATSAVIRAKRA
jgi:hypothetical protein